MRNKIAIILCLVVSFAFMLSACSGNVQEIANSQTISYNLRTHGDTGAPVTTGSSSTVGSTGINEPEATAGKQTPDNKTANPGVTATKDKPSATLMASPTASPAASPTASTPKPVQNSPAIEVTPYGEVPVFYPDEPNADKPLSGKVIGLDPGHQAKGNSQKEPNAPGSSVMKAKCTTGATGAFTGTLESEINLSVALMLKDYLLEQGATVVMVRQSQNVDISNAQRALVFNEYETDLSIRLHCNSFSNQSVKGVLMMKPQKHAYLKESYDASEMIIKEVISETGALRRDDIITSDMTGFNWCTRPVVLIEMGFLSNPEEDRLLSSTEYQNKLARAICSGTVKYFLS